MERSPVIRALDKLGSTPFEIYCNLKAACITATRKDMRGNSQCLVAKYLQENGFAAARVGVSKVWLGHGKMEDVPKVIEEFIVQVCTNKYPDLMEDNKVEDQGVLCSNRV